MPTAELPPEFGGQGSVPSPATEGRTDMLERRQGAFKFFSDLITGAGLKQPRGEWDKAHDNYEDDPAKPKLVNLWRAKVDTQAAFLAGEEAVLRFTVPTAHVDDAVIDQRRDTEQAVYDYIHAEMGFADKLDDFRHSADVTNVGFLVHQPDIDKWLPSIIYLEPEQVAIDGACGADMASAGWVAYSQYSSPDELHAHYPAVPIEVFRLAAAKKGFQSAATDSDEARAARGRLDQSPEAKDTLKQCRVWRFYARGHFALYDHTPDAQGKAEGGGEDAMRPGAEFDTPEGEARRYLFLVEGMDVPLLDQMGWPPLLLLDKDEWPITELTYNKARKSVYGFPDYRHEKSLLEEIERVVKDLTAKHGLEGLKVVTSGGLSKTAKRGLKKFLEGKGIQVLEDCIDGNGNAQVKVLELPGLSADDLTYLTTLIEMYDQISMQPRATRGNEDPDKTATATQVETDMATARANRRLRMYEAALAVVAKKTMQMAHAMLPTLTQVQVPGVEELAELPYAAVEALMQEIPGAKIVQLGVEAMAGEDSVAWLAMPEGDDTRGFIALLLRSVRISVERGSTQRHVRLQKVAAFRQVFAEVLLPTVQALGAPSALVESVKKMLGMMGLDEFDSIVKELEVAAAGLAMQQAAEQAAAQAALAAPGAQVAPGGGAAAPQSAPAPAAAPAPQVVQGGGI